MSIVNEKRVIESINMNKGYCFNLGWCLLVYDQ